MKKCANISYPAVEAESARYKISQEDLAKKLDIERKTYYNGLVNGNIPVNTLIKLSDLFNCPIDYLLE